MREVEGVAKRFNNFPKQSRDTKKRRKTKLVSCSVCGNDTYQKDCICVLCKNQITQLYRELIDLLAADRREVVCRRKKVLRYK